jgi:hypothetical protein
MPNEYSEAYSDDENEENEPEEEQMPSEDEDNDISIETNELNQPEGQQNSGRKKRGLKNGLSLAKQAKKTTPVANKNLNVNSSGGNSSNLCTSSSSSDENLADNLMGVNSSSIKAGLNNYNYNMMYQSQLQNSSSQFLSSFLTSTANTAPSSGNPQYMGNQYTGFNQTSTSQPSSESMAYSTAGFPYNPYTQSSSQYYQNGAVSGNYASKYVPNTTGYQAGVVQTQNEFVSSSNTNPQFVYQQSQPVGSNPYVLGNCGPSTASNGHNSDYFMVNNNLLNVKQQLVTSSPLQASINSNNGNNGAGPGHSSSSLIVANVVLSQFQSS